MEGVEGVIYLIHFERPFGHARHYLGWSQNLEQRLSDHSRGRGAVLMREVTRAGIGWRVVRTWTGDRYHERRLKNGGGRSKLCPVCKEERRAAKAAAKEQAAL